MIILRFNTTTRDHKEPFVASNSYVLDAAPKCQRSRGGWHGPRYPVPRCADECVNSAVHVTGEDIWPKGDINDALGASDEQ